MFTTALFTIAKIWKEYKCSLADELVKKEDVVYVCVQFSSVAQSCLTLCDPMDYSTPGLHVHHQLLEFTQIRVH